MKQPFIKVKRKKYIFLSVFLLLGIGSAAAILLVRAQSSKWEPEQFEIVNGIPYIVEDGILYMYTAEGKWLPKENIGESKQLVAGEALCVLREDGRLYYEGDLDISEDTPLTDAYFMHMAQTLLAINEREPFACISGSLETECTALLDNGSLLIPVSGEYEYCRMDEFAVEEAPTYLSGNFILTEQGNVYYVKNETDNSVNLTLNCIYDDGNIVTLDSSYTTGECLGLTGDGNVISWQTSERFSPLPVSDWKNISYIAQGFHFAVGLTEKGQVLYAAAHDPEKNAETAAALEAWGKITRIAVYGTKIYGLKPDRSCVSLEIKL